MLKFIRFLLYRILMLKKFLTEYYNCYLKAPAYYPKDALTDKPERFFVNEIIREKILLNYEKEIPYAVEIEPKNLLKTEDIIRIRSVIMVERETQKGIIIGHKGLLQLKELD
jgi:GTP-binding protein Era